jgi:hypothetical protein
VTKLSPVKTGQGRSAREASSATGHLLLAVAALALHMQQPAGAAAQTVGDEAGGRARAALLTTTRVKSGATAERDSAFDAVVHTALDKLGVVEVVARPALDLEAIQLSLDCVGETSRCLVAVARHTKADILLAPSIQRIGEELVLSILYFDARGTTEIRRASRRQTGHTLKAETLDEVPDMLRELFQVEEQPATPSEPPTAVEPQLSADESYTDSYEPTHDRGVPVGPLLLGGGGVLVLGGGVAAFLIMKDTEDEYASIVVDDDESLEQARDKRDQGQTQALIASVLIGTGAAALAAGAVWLAVEVGGNEERRQTALRPWLAPGHAGLLLTGTLGDEL